MKDVDGSAAAVNPSSAPHLDFNIPSLVYKDGDKLIVEATATPEYEGYLYVDFLDSEGAVLHLLPAPEHRDNHLRPNQKLRLGGDVYAIGAPYGPNLVVAISSPKRLFAPRPEQQETANAYLPVLSNALREAAGGPASQRPVAA